MNTPFETFLKQHDEESWAAALTTLLRSIHEVDRNATQIWFSFYPLSLFEALERAEDAEKLAQQLLMQGNYYLKDQIDSSHTFLYGHRYWPEVKTALQKHAREFSPSETRSLADQIVSVAQKAATQAKVDQSLVVGITAVAFMTIRQAGLDIQIACSLGMLTQDQVDQLVAMGVHRYNHNLETARSHFPSVVTTHTWQERWDTLSMVRDAGMEVCCGGIVGMGESVEQRADDIDERIEDEQDARADRQGAREQKRRVDG